MKICRLQSGVPHAVLQNAGRRRGGLLVELVVCTILLSVVAAILVPGVQAIRVQRKATRFETLALVELNNLAAQLPLAADIADLTVSTFFERRYPDATLKIEAGDGDDVSLQPVKITISRPHGPSRPDLSRTLTVWISEAGSTAAKESR